MKNQMGKDTMKERIQEAIATGDDALVRKRVEVCLWGLRTMKEGPAEANELIAELGLEKYGAKKE
jgi:hypothetical protein